MPEQFKVRSRTPVREVARSGKNFCLQLESGERVSARNVILATGRAGHLFTRAALSSLEAPFQENKADIGLRLETTSTFFAEGFFYQTDPKFKFGHGDLGSSRTFCSCRGGYIVPVKFGNGFFADGAFLNVPTGLTNVALMVRSNDVLASSEIDRWCEAVNATTGRRLLLGEITASNPKSTAAAILDSIPLWPSEIHRLLMKELLDNVVSGRHIHMFSWKGAGQKIRVYGPCVDRYWPAPTLAEGFRTEVEGLSVIGDATGLSRGILQAVASGVGWALVEIARQGTYSGARIRTASQVAA